MNIAIIGGGERSRSVMELIDKHTFKKIQPRIVAVADQKPSAPAIVAAYKKGIFVTTDYNDLFARDGIDLIIELTGDQSVFNDILLKKKDSVRAIDHRTALLFWNFAYLQQKTSNQYDIMFNHLMQEDVMIIGTDYRIQEINASMLKRLGLSREDALGKHCYEITHHEINPCNGKDHPCPLDKAIKTSHPFKATHRHFDLDNNEHYLSISCYPLFDNGEIVAVAELAKDITEEINFHKALLANEKLASIGRLAAGVAHEINNPMTTILTSAMLIQEDIDPNWPYYEELKTIVNETLRCRKIVTSLLNFARQTKPVKKLTAVKDVINNCILLVQKQAAFNDITITLEHAREAPPVFIDRDQIRQALINLLLNAIDASAAGAKIKIMTDFDNAKMAATIKIMDTGKGIQPEQISKIFEPFFTTKDGGTGLGLAITHGIIEQHGGTLKVKSTPGVLTTFTISLPVPQGNRYAS